MGATVYAHAARGLSAVAEFLWLRFFVCFSRDVKRRKMDRTQYTLASTQQQQQRRRRWWWWWWLMRDKFRWTTHRTTRHPLTTWPPHWLVLTIYELVRRTRHVKTRTLNVDHDNS